jgi:hypothetical protein
VAATSKRKAETTIGRVDIAWTSAADGTATVATDPVRGHIRRVTFVPGTAGSQPTDLYDLTLTDEHSINVLGGQGANLSNAANSHVAPGVPLKDGTTTHVVPPFVEGVLTLNVTNAGNAKSGAVILYIDN